MGRPKSLLIPRFLNYINKTDTCWLWMGYKDTDGYGIFSIDCKNRRAHRVSYELWKENIPDDLLLRHKCDVRNCVNPNHLEVGTYKDNSNDMVKRGRSLKGDKHPSRLHPERLARGENNGSKTHPERVARGSNNGNSKLTEDDVREIRIFKGFGFTNAELGRMYEMTDVGIGLIINYKKWKHI